MKLELYLGAERKESEISEKTSMLEQQPGKEENSRDVPCTEMGVHGVWDEPVNRTWRAGQAPTHFCRTEDFSEVVWLVSFCKKMKEAIKDKTEFIIWGSKWYRLEKSFMEETKCSAS